MRHFVPVQVWLNGTKLPAWSNWLPTARHRPVLTHEIALNALYPDPLGVGESRTAQRVPVQRSVNVANLPDVRSCSPTARQRSARLHAIPCRMDDWNAFLPGEALGTSDHAEPSHSSARVTS